MTGILYLMDGLLIGLGKEICTMEELKTKIKFTRERDLGQIYDAPLDVVLGEGMEREVVQPDIMFISEGRSIIAEEIRGAPDLVVEVISPGTEERDRGYKKTLYARYGMKEYWIVDPKERKAKLCRHLKNL